MARVNCSIIAQSVAMVSRVLIVLSKERACVVKKGGKIFEEMERLKNEEIKKKVKLFYICAFYRISSLLATSVIC